MKIDYEFLEKRPLSQSSGKHFLRSPLHYVQYLNQEPVDSDAFTLGKCVDTLLFEPSMYDYRFILTPKFDRRTKQGKMDYDKFLEDNPNKTWLTEEIAFKAKEMVKSTHSHAPAMRLLENIVQVQQRIEWVDKATGIKCVTIPDAKTEHELISLKTTADADPEFFWQDAYKFGYPLQTGFELEAMKVRNFEFPTYKYIIVENKAPFCVNVSGISDHYEQYAKMMYRKLLDRFKYCMENNLFEQGYEFKSTIPQTNEHTLDLPPWAKRQLEDE